MLSIDLHVLYLRIIALEQHFAIFDWAQSAGALHAKLYPKRRAFHKACRAALHMTKGERFLVRSLHNNNLQLIIGGL